MIDVFGFPVAMAVSMGMIVIGYFFAVHSPVLLALFTVWRQRKTMPCRVLFVVTVMGATYGLLVLFLMVICVPISAFLVFIVPAVKDQGYLKGSVFLAVADFVVAWWWAILPFAVLLPAIFISRYFATRWNRIVEALHG